MIKIRTKLLIYFAISILLIVLLFLIREQSNKEVKEVYEDNESYLFLLNEITKQTNDTFQSLQIYVDEPFIENLTFYHDNKDELLELQQAFSAREKGGIQQENFLNIITTFLRQTDKTVEAVDDQDIKQYSASLNEVENMSGYIHEMALELIDRRLTNSQAISSLLNQKIKQTKNMWFMIIIAIILLSILFALWFSNGITQTIQRLTRAAEQISARNYSEKDVVVSRKDELWFLTKTFNEMKKNILESVSEIKEKARLAQLLKEMELKSLQNQINPHFLFNTLNTISKTSYIEGAERTNDLISSVSALLRYNISNLERETTLKDEVKIVKEYFFIQKTRFGDRVAFIENIDPSCLDVPIPCLTLQPIIENAFIHGIEDKASGAKIELKIYQERERVLIEVHDNGVGMDKQTIDQLLDTSDEQKVAVDKKGSGHSTGIGMKNVINRLRLFQKGSKVTISSTLGKGTTVAISLNKGRRNTRDHSNVGRR
ncbi:sensor histidine kinase [Aquibacillus salsiterrae]|uniref:histidine kinase n=1 Tax=Aquibacillus salsiterrae TaxID=2950439 RepID=A0A9X4AFY8_9BACI|nr:histidine kinase [Aquibacillus salsiterrae]MDC3418406.1 histidine kinase [Aquibacillus salsiterrae]